MLDLTGSCSLQIVKNKCAAPYKLAEFDILFGSGISSEGCTLDAAEAVGVVSRKGSWYRCGPWLSVWSAQQPFLQHRQCWLVNAHMTLLCNSR